MSWIATNIAAIFICVFFLQIVDITKAQSGRLPACGTTFYESEVGVPQFIRSRSGRSGAYPNNENCWWIILSPNGTVIRLTFQIFQIQTRDSVAIYDSQRNRTDPQRLVGSRLFGRRRQGFQITSPRNFLAINFRSGFNLRRRTGFTFTFESLVIGSRDENSNLVVTPRTLITRRPGNCGTSLTAEEEPKPLNHPENANFYRSNEECHWRITAAEGFIVQFTIGRINTERCCDYIEIFDQNERVIKLVGDLKNEIYAYNSSSSNGFFVIFHSDRSVNLRGFRAVFRAVPNARPYPFLPLLSFCGQEFNATSSFQNLTSPNWPSSYPEATECMWKIYGATGMVIEFVINFADFERCCDYMVVSDMGLNGTRVNNVIEPQRFLSNGSSLWIHMHSDKSIVRRGFHGYYRQIPAPTTTTTLAPTTMGLVKEARDAINFISDLPRVDRNCGEDFKANNRSVRLNSPQYPRLYPANANCIWRIIPIRNQQVQLIIGDVATEACCDNITVFDGRTLLDTLAGTDSEPRTFFSGINNVMTIRFSSDKTKNDFGFRGVFRSYTESNEMTLVLPPKDTCGFTVEATATSQNFTTPEYPVFYPPNVECLWEITPATEGMVIRLTVVEGQSENCCDYMEIFDGFSRSLGQVRGTVATPRIFTSTGPRMEIQFQSDYSTSFRGFLITYQEVAPEAQPTTAPASALPVCEFEMVVDDDEPLEITSPNYPEAYPPLTRCTWTIRIANETNRQLVLRINEVITEPCCDYLRVSYEPGTEIRRFLGSEVNQTITPPGSTAILFFFSDSSDQRKGFSATASSVDRASLLSLGVLPATKPETFCGSEENATLTPQFFSTPGWPDIYPNNLACHWRFVAPPTRKIRIDISQIETEDCCDIIRVADDEQLVTMLRGTVGQYFYVSTSNILQINFTTDRSGQRSGFRGVFALVPLPTTTTTTTTTTPTTTTTTTTTATTTTTTTPAPTTTTTTPAPTTTTTTPAPTTTTTTPAPTTTTTTPAPTTTTTTPAPTTTTTTPAPTTTTTTPAPTTTTTTPAPTTTTTTPAPTTTTTTPAPTTTTTTPAPTTTTTTPAPTTTTTTPAPTTTTTTPAPTTTTTTPAPTTTTMTPAPTTTTTTPAQTTTTTTPAPTTTTTTPAQTTTTTTPAPTTTTTRPAPTTTTTTPAPTTTTTTSAPTTTTTTPAPTTTTTTPAPTTTTTTPAPTTTTTTSAPTTTTTTPAPTTTTTTTPAPTTTTTTPAPTTTTTTPAPTTTTTTPAPTTTTTTPAPTTTTTTAAPTTTTTTPAPTTTTTTPAPTTTTTTTAPTTTTTTPAPTTTTTTPAPTITTTTPAPTTTTTTPAPTTTTTILAPTTTTTTPASTTAPAAPEPTTTPSSTPSTAAPTTTSTTTSTSATITTTPVSTTASTTVETTTPKIIEYSNCGRFLLNLDSTIFHIKSPNYPDKYPDNSDCSWTVEAPEGMSIDVTFKQLDVEECCDCIEVLDGKDKRLMARSDQSKMVKKYRTTTNKLELQFISDYSIAKDGFFIVVEQGPRTSYNPGRCGFTRVAGFEPMTFHSPSYPTQYPSNMDCSWLIISEEPNRPVEITINDLKVETCCDGLQVRDGRSIESPLIKEVKEWEEDLTFTSSFDGLYLRFRSDFSVSYRGFSISFRLSDRIRSYPRHCYRPMNIEDGETSVFSNRSVVECGEKSTCILANASSVMLTVQDHGNRPVSADMIEYGTCAPTSLCDSKPCDALQTLLSREGLPVNIVSAQCSVTCCSLDYCNKGKPQPQPDVIPGTVLFDSTNVATLMETVVNTGCWRHVLDLMFVMDGSKSMGQTNFDKTLEFVKDVVAPLDLRQVHVGVMQYSYWIDTRQITDQPFFDTFIRIGQYTDHNDLRLALTGVELLDDNSTYTAHAIEKAAISDIVSSPRFTASCTNKAIVVVTDSRADDDEFLSTFAEITRSMDIKLYAVGVDNYDLSQLQIISTGSVGNNTNVFTTNDFDGLPSLTESLRTSLQHAK